MTTIHVYRDKKKQWRWRMLRKGRIVANGAGDGYKRRKELHQAIDQTIRDCRNDRITWTGAI